jgi:ribosomal protein S27E
MSPMPDSVESSRSPLKRAPCPNCGEPWLRPTQLPGRLRCVNCLSRFELVSACPNCGEHQTILRMSNTEDMQCQSCGASMLKES